MKHIQSFGATATDSIDGNLTSNIVISGDKVSGSIPGTYTIKYTVKNSTGKEASVTRTVTVE